MAVMSVIKMHMLNMFYVCLNLSPFLLPLSSYTFWKKGNRTAVYTMLGFLATDLLVPLKSEGPWLWWCKLTLATRGKLSYHKANVIVETKFEKDKNYLIGYHPHGLWAYAFDLVFDAVMSQHGIHIVSAGADAVFKVPLLRRVMSWWGLTRVSKASLRASLQRPYPRNVTALAPGGIAEMFYGLKEEQVVLARRKGFCKIALETGAHLVPLYSFGANELYTRFWGSKSLAAKISKRMSTSIVVWTGRFGFPFGFIPHPTKLVVVIGPAIEVEKVAEPSQDQVDALHAKYVAALRTLFEKHRSEMGDGWRRQRLYLENEPIEDTVKG
eukprot:TRINITY_DN78190_c0_g1_i1.p1 TRINITY_DN78190_c0_g1~~TRINITY_DN78190_c0_g1_i1.p1  ORF type:complete len:345 (+),score=29.65 TRINITY_DN78190_c0_g1_i1:58-1035(+)